MCNKTAFSPNAPRANGKEALLPIGNRQSLGVNTLILINSRWMRGALGKGQLPLLASGLS